MEQDQPITVGHGKVRIMEGDKAATLLAVNAVTDKAQHMVAIGEIQGAVRFIHEHYRSLLYHAASQQHQLLLPLTQGTEIYICPVGQTETPQYC